MPSIWNIMPFSGDVMGLRMDEALIRGRADGLDLDRLRSFLLDFEAGFTAGLREAKEPEE
ncbi:hypothetical protein [Roseibium suaedae]|nr:hypothetical protein [Roseibium suaedae]